MRLRLLLLPVCLLRGDHGLRVRDEVIHDSRELVGGTQSCWRCRKVLWRTVWGGA